MTPGQVKHLFGLKLVQMPDDTCKLIGIVVSSPKLKGPNAEPAAAVQTTMGVINVGPNQFAIKGSIHCLDCSLFGKAKISSMSQFPTLGHSITLLP